MRFRCLACDEASHVFEIKDADLEWEVVDSSERESGMGPRYTHQAEWEETCPQCDTSVSATFRTEEYPAGTVEFSEMESDDIEPENPREQLQHDVTFRDDLEDEAY